MAIDCDADDEGRDVEKETAERGNEGFAGYVSEEEGEKLFGV